MDVILQRSEGGVDSALLYSKTVSKYMKDLMTYVEKRTSLGEWQDPSAANELMITASEM